MTQGDTNTSMEYARTLYYALTDLLDAISYSDRAMEDQNDLDDFNTQIKVRMDRVDKIKDDISKLLKAFQEEPNSKGFQEYADQLMEFTGVLLGKYKDKVSKEIASNQQNILNSVESDRSKATKSAEAFFARDPIPVNERNFSVKFVDGAYDVRIKNRCPRDIYYEFAANTKDSELLKSQLYFSSLSRGFKIPVRTAETWISKDPAVDYEKLDRYFMESAELTKQNLSVIFMDPEKESQFKIVLSRADSSIFMDVEYSDRIQKVDVTSQPALNNKLESGELTNIMDKITKNIADLQSKKLKLIKLSLRDTDILTKMNYFDLIINVFSIIEEEISPIISRLLAGEKLAISGSDVLDLEFLKGKLALFEERAKEVASALGMSGIMDRINPA
ncbi:hypothetical protein OXIME_000610 [Oxyplasma meridianum]|uniref:Uncharacterized protein n=1 Tax=Oxyplasma meridianum TaxID=3073602 RepID=A0AAX4NEZ5_9ARCH